MGHSDALRAKLARAWPPADWQDTGVLLAVSGGADSVALARAMAAIRTHRTGRLAVAHFNHRLRGADSEADEAFVVALARQLSLECVSGSANVAAAKGEGLEAAARAARYAFLQQTAEARGDRYVVTAHTADDQAETVLHHILRGTGLAGVAGMSRTRLLGNAVTLMRPMLEIRRQEVLDYLTSLGQPYREDASNRDLRFTRNRIRHELLPQITRDYAPGVVESLLRLSTLAADAQRLIETAAGELLDRAVVETSGACVTLDCSVLAGQDRHLVREAFLAIWRRQRWGQRKMGFAQWDLLAEMALADSGATAGLSSGAICKRVLPSAITAQKRDERLTLFAPVEATESKTASPPPQA